MQGLPRDAAAWREDVKAWTQEHELLATVLENQDGWARLIHRALLGIGGVKPADLPKYGEPLRLEHPDRPEPPRPKRRVVSLAEAMKPGGEGVMK